MIRRTAAWLRRRTRLPWRASGWRTAWLLGPHLILGTWLLLVPDRVAFTTSQIAALAHVLLAIATLPPLVWFGLRHAFRARGDRAESAAVPGVAIWAIAITATAAVITGIAALRSGRGMPMAFAHAVAGVAVAPPLALHLYASGKRIAAAITLATVALATAGSAVAAQLVPPLPEEPLTPPFAYATARSDLYDSAQWCGECHEEIYREWKQSLHARALEPAGVRREFRDNASPARRQLLGLSLADFGRIVETHSEHHRIDGLDEGVPSLEACQQCHAPGLFYGDDRHPLYESQSPAVVDAVGCAFCHTVRDVRIGGDLRPVIRQVKATGDMDVGAFLSQAPYYVWAPGSVRRYLGQDSSSPVVRYWSNLLIRWRPDMHRHDYGSRILKSSEVCMGCHGLGLGAPESVSKSYWQWHDGPYAQGANAVECQDCHMVRPDHMNGAPVAEEAPLVPWGPVREQRRSHLFLGGNARTQHDLGNDTIARLEHELSTRALSVRIVGAARYAGGAHVKVSVANELVGHNFPASDTNVRVGGIGLNAVDGNGKTIARLSPDMSNHPAPGGAPVLRQCLDPGFTLTCDTTLPAKAEQTYDMDLPIPPGAVMPVSIMAELFHTLDSDPIATSAAVTLP